MRTTLVVASGPGREAYVIGALESVFSLGVCEDAVVAWDGSVPPLLPVPFRDRVRFECGTGFRHVLRVVENIAETAGFAFWIRDDERLMATGSGQVPTPITPDLVALKRRGVWLDICRTDGVGHPEPRFFAAGFRFPLNIRPSLFGVPPGLTDGELRVTSLGILRTRSADPAEIRLNIGCGSRTFSGWVNIDHDLECAPDRLIDVGTTLLPYSDQSVEAIYCSHALDHLSWREGRFFLRECFRVLRVGAPIRVVVCDLRAFAEAYLDGTIDKFAWFQPPEFRAARTPGMKFGFVACGNMGDRGSWRGHKHLYDAASLCEMIQAAGFRNVQARGENEYAPEFRDVDDVFPGSSVYVEGHAPG